MEQIETAAREYLRRRKNRNINLLSALQGGIARVVVMEEGGCLLHTGAGIWQIAAEDEAAALRLLDAVPAEATMLEVQNREQIEAVAARFRPKSVELYHNAWYAGEHIDLPEAELTIRTMEAGDTDFLARHYHMPGTTAADFEIIRAYMVERVSSGTMFGVFQAGEIVGFAGNHDEGSIGMLTVLPQFRRRGLGKYLEQVAISRALSRGDIPFGQIAPDNEASLALQRSLGMTISEELVCWMDR